ncbi:MAG: sigma-54-dependent Fis family transcriptional regulator [Proteobacteria bacterium]|nr:sigma-54-dependent Fis family transcriptional regulator [Pseudomonadota bacterium]
MAEGPTPGDLLPGAASPGAVLPVDVLVVDDDPAVLRAWRSILRDPHYRLTLLADPLEAAARLAELRIDVAVIDLRMPRLDGLELLGRIKTERPEVEVVMMTGAGTVADAVQAIKRGAFDFLSKPFAGNEAAELTVRRAAELHRRERRLAQLEREVQGDALHRIVGQSPQILQVAALIRSVAASPATVLITGESGTGKQLVALAIHALSPRAAKPLVQLNCGALAETLLESELFGHSKGAFTGATADHPGLFVAADQGSIFLDEVGDISPAMQAKLLRTLQEGEVRPVGAIRTRLVDVRVIAATNRNLEREAQQGRFREDLFYRLNVVRIEVPPLRERGEDVLLLAEHLLRKHAQRMGRRLEGFEPPAMRALEQYAWPGNVRQLENAVERAVVLARGSSITLADLPAQISGAAPSKASVAPELLDLPFPAAKRQAVAHFERSYLTQLLARHDSVSEAARSAGLNRSNLRRLLRRHQLG